MSGEGENESDSGEKPDSSAPNFDIYRQHIKSNTALLGSIGQFCAAFYHVPESENRNWRCLDEDNCPVAKMVKESKKEHPKWTPPKSVAALVKYEMQDGNDIIVRYSNEYTRKRTKHAEDFFSDDILKQPQDEALENSISEGNLRKITMYITFQPCHLSTTNTPKKSCCDVLLMLLNDSRLKDVKMCIKPTHIFKAGSKHPDLVENGEQGIRYLMAHRRIEITKMEEADWNFLLNLVATNDDQRRSIPPYSKSVREALDKETGAFLRDVKSKVELALKCPSTDNRLSKEHCLVKQDGIPHLFDNLFQFCAFFHVFEQGEGKKSLCLSERQCPYDINGKWKPNVIVVKGTYQEGEPTYEAKYTDCHRFGIKAEEFLHDDVITARNGLGTSVAVDRIIIYTTWLRRGFNIMVSVLCRHLMEKGVELCIKPSHVYGGNDVQNEVDALRDKGITVKEMREDDWKYLKDMPVAVEVPEEMFEDRRRKSLDDYIGRILNPRASSGSNGSDSGGSNGSDSGGSLSLLLRESMQLNPTASSGGGDCSGGSGNSQGLSAVIDYRNNLKLVDGGKVEWHGDEEELNNFLEKFTGCDKWSHTETCGDLELKSTSKSTNLIVRWYKSSTKTLRFQGKEGVSMKKKLIDDFQKATPPRGPTDSTT